MKFSIRDLFLVTLIVALVLGWLGDHCRLGRAVTDAQYEAETWKHWFKASSEVHQNLATQLEDFGLEVTIEGVKRKSPPNSSALAPNPPKP